MPATLQITVTSIADTAITAQSLCRNIYVNEDPGVANWPTTDYLIKKPVPPETPSGTTAARKVAGSQYVFMCSYGFFVAGQIVGYIRTVTGTTTFDQDEDAALGNFRNLLK